MKGTKRLFTTDLRKTRDTMASKRTKQSKREGQVCRERNWEGKGKREEHEEGLEGDAPLPG